MTTPQDQNQALRRRIDAAMLESLTGTFRILADGGPFICSFNPHDVADMLTRASYIVRPTLTEVQEDQRETDQAATALADASCGI